MKLEVGALYRLGNSVWPIGVGANGQREIDAYNTPENELRYRQHLNLIRSGKLSEYVERQVGRLRVGENVAVIDESPDTIRVEVMSRFGPVWVMRHYLFPVE